MSVARFLFALGIRDVGEATALALAQHFETLDRLRAADEAEIQQVLDVGPVVAANAAAYFRDPQNIRMLERLLAAGIAWPAMRSAASAGGLAGKSFVLTGTLTTMTREEAQARIMDAGGKVGSSVSAKTSYLVMGAEPGSKLKKATTLGVTVLHEAGFTELLKSSSRS